MKKKKYFIKHEKVVECYRFYF